MLIQALMGYCCNNSLYLRTPNFSQVPTPVHVNPSPTKPSLQLQTKLPGVLVHVASLLHMSGSRHSSIST